MNKQQRTQSTRKRYRPITSLVNGLLLLLLIFAFNSCKKELYNGERIDPKRKKELLDYKNGPKIEVINLAQFKNKVNLNALGTLKQEFVSASPSKSNLMSIKTAETYLGFSIITDNIKVIKDKGHTMYVFAVELSSKRAVSFQNLTIDESASGTVAFVNTYTPNKKWISDHKKGRPGKFEGDVKVNYLNLNNSSIGNKKSGQNSVSVVICTPTSYYFEIAYFCASGAHYPWDPGCELMGEEAAGYALFEAIITTCEEQPDQGGGGTTPTPPPGYDPCPDAPPLISSKKLLGNMIMVLPPTECDSVETRLPEDTDEIRTFEADYRTRMSAPELVIFDKMPRLQQIQYLVNAQSAVDLSSNRYPNLPITDSKRDAFRHAYFNLLNVYSLGTALAASLANAHEEGATPAIAVQMDLFNNQAGRDAFTTLPAGTSAHTYYWPYIDALLTSGGLRYIKNGVLTPTNQ